MVRWNRADSHRVIRPSRVDSGVPRTTGSAAGLSLSSIVQSQTDYRSARRANLAGSPSQYLTDRLSRMEMATRALDLVMYWVCLLAASPWLVNSTARVGKSLPMKKERAVTSSRLQEACS